MQTSGQGYWRVERPADQIFAENLWRIVAFRSGACPQVCGADLVGKPAGRECRSVAVRHALLLHQYVWRCALEAPCAQFTAVFSAFLIPPGPGNDLTGMGSCPAVIQQLIEEQLEGEMTIQYVRSPVYADAMILRDRDLNCDGETE